ncbi:hypothetical protein BC827DRAFT_349894 [Russula dissimulans]|nr:hypothetical protein BC827DRAFT_349894 [Russula dissimulans]
MSGFVDRCVDSRRFQLAPIAEKGVPGRRLASRRVEFTKDDDEHLCQYIAQVLPYKEDGGRTGHFIYVDLLRRAREFGQYSWAHRHPKDSWRERYRKNRDRMDERIAEIAEENPLPRDGKGLYKSRRFGNIDKDDEWMDADDEPPDLGEGERSESATDNEDGPVQVQTKRMEVQRREEEEEEEGDEDVGAAKHQLATEPSQPSQAAETQGREEVEEQTTKLQPETGPPADVAARRTRISLNREPVQTRRRTARRRF